MQPTQLGMVGYGEVGNIITAGLARDGVFGGLRNIPTWQDYVDRMIEKHRQANPTCYIFNSL